MPAATLSLLAILVLGSAYAWVHWPVPAINATGADRGSGILDHPPVNPDIEFGPLRVRPGDTLPEAALLTLDGDQVSLPSDAERLPLVIEFGSATCPICVGQLPGMQRLAQSYAGKAAFLFVYTREAHRPALTGGPYLQNGIPRRQALDMDERRAGAQQMRAAIEPARTILLDGFGDDSVYAQLFAESGADNPLIIADAHGKIVLVQRWADAEAVESFLKQHGRELVADPADALHQ